MNDRLLIAQYYTGSKKKQFLALFWVFSVLCLLLLDAITFLIMQTNYLLWCLWYSTFITCFFVLDVMMLFSAANLMIWFRNPRLKVLGGCSLVYGLFPKKILIILASILLVSGFGWSTALMRQQTIPSPDGSMKAVHYQLQTGAVGVDQDIWAIERNSKLPKTLYVYADCPEPAVHWQGNRLLHLENIVLDVEGPMQEIHGLNSCPWSHLHED